MKRALIALAAVLAALLPASAQEERYPSRPVTIVVAIGAGSGLDLATRFLAVKLEKRLGQPFVIENRPGMAGGVGSAAVARAAPDGYTLLTSFLSANVFNPIIHKKLPYDVNDLRYVTLLYDTPFTLVVPSASGITRYRQLVDMLKKNPTRYSYGSGGVGSAAHVAAAMFLRLSGAEGVVHVPYRTTPALFPDLISNRIAFGIFSPDSVQSHVRDGNLRALFVTGDKRLPSWPDVPTAAEVGLPEMKASSWYVMQAPAKTPDAIVNRLAHELDEILREPDTVARFAQAESVPLYGYTPEQTAAFVEEERKKWEPHVRASGAVVE